MKKIIVFLKAITAGVVMVALILVAIVAFFGGIGLFFFILDFFGLILSFAILLSSAILLSFLYFFGRDGLELLEEFLEKSKGKESSL